MPSPVRIGVIGAGSATFSLGLVKDLCLTPNLEGSEVHFMDIDAERLDAVTRMAGRYTDEVGARLRFQQTTDRAEALRGCDFVIDTAMVQSHHHQADMRELMARHGYYYRGVEAGSFYQFGVMMELGRDMERLCPEAWLIQSGNPVFDGCTLMTREMPVRICGLCHGHLGYLHIVDELGLDLDRVDFEAPGVNHCIWMTSFRYDGEDAYPLIDRWIEEEGENYWATHEAGSTHDIQLARGTIHQYRMYGLMPIGDTPRRGGWWYHTDIATKKHWYGEPYGGPDTHIARPVFVERLDRRMEQVRAACADPEARMTEVFGTTRTQEQQVPIIDALANDVRGKFQVNVPNRGALPGVEDDVVVEVPAVIDGEGIRPLRLEPLPKKIMLEQVLPEILRMERELEAYRTGDRSMLLWETLENHQTRSYEQAWSALEELLEQPANRELAQHFRYPWAEGEERRYLRAGGAVGAG